MKVSLLLTLLSSVIIFIMGISLITINSEIKTLNPFLSNAKNTQPNFEKSLILYTNSTKAIIEYLVTLRPENKEGYVNFISKIENIGNELKLNLDLQSVKTSDTKQKSEEENTITYILKCYGTSDDLNVLLKKIEALPYFIRIDDIKYKNPQYLTDKEKESPNISFKLNLYVK